MERNKVMRQRNFMSTTITLTMIQTPKFSTVEILDAIEAAFGEFDRIVKRFTRFNEDSELSNLNRNSGNWVKVTPEMFMLVEEMLKLSQATDGAFDPTVIDFLETYGYDPNYNFSKLDNPDLDNMVKNMADTRPSWREIELDKENNSIKLAPKQRLDLGGIGKGYAVDLAFDILKRFENVLIDAGGDLRALGQNENEEPWQLAMKHLAKGQDPKDAEIIGVIKTEKLSLACSGSWARKVKQFHHIIDPRTGKPTEEMQTVYVAAPTATEADSWATALFVGGKDLLEKLPQHIQALLIYPNNKALHTPDFPPFN
jgi:FAD:protein FMN transferase